MIWMRIIVALVECYGACAEAWPPVRTKGAATAEDGASSCTLTSLSAQEMHKAAAGLEN